MFYYEYMYGRFLDYVLFYRKWCEKSLIIEFVYKNKNLNGFKKK